MLVYKVITESSSNLFQKKHTLESNVLINQSLNQHILCQVKYFLGVLIHLTFWISVRENNKISVFCSAPITQSELKLRWVRLIPKAFSRTTRGVKSGRPFYAESCHLCRYLRDDTACEKCLLKGGGGVCL